MMLDLHYPKQRKQKVMKQEVTKQGASVAYIF